MAVAVSFVPVFVFAFAFFFTFNEISTFTCLFYKCLFCAYYVPDIILGAGDTAMNETDKTSALMNDILMREDK